MLSKHLLYGHLLLKMSEFIIHYVYLSSLGPPPTKHRNMRVAHTLVWHHTQGTPHLGSPCCFCWVAKSCPALFWSRGLKHARLLSHGIFQASIVHSGLPFPSPGNHPDPGIELASPPLAGGFFTIEPPGKPLESSRLPVIDCLKLL